MLAEVSIGMDPRIALAFLSFLIMMSVLTVTIAMTFRFKKREMDYRERMAALERGIPFPAEEVPRRQAAPWTPRTFLLRGLIWALTGLALTVFLIGLSLATRHERPAFERVSQANSARANGATEDQIRQIMNDTQQQGMPLGVALIGLIPIGLGLAYLITYGSETSAGSATETAQQRPRV